MSKSIFVLDFVTHLTWWIIHHTLSP
ncbi:hypothetical protein CBM2608_A50015 [Cupriavidus taiwanensis]|nr:hypothetical protein CBM2608_A50015 [Cupriavidus taiwanensis]